MGLLKVRTFLVYWSALGLWGTPGQCWAASLGRYCRRHFKVYTAVTVCLMLLKL